MVRQQRREEALNERALEDGDAAAFANERLGAPLITRLFAPQRRGTSLALIPRPEVMIPHAEVPTPSPKLLRNGGPVVAPRGRIGPYWAPLVIVTGLIALAAAQTFRTLF